ncbi:unnamed protein product [Candida verbasci]|uniref:Rhomboid-type serine protease n=1 Tax=Candida verbasci TaxID=1227364 RepID=A0A9W4XKL2_9ASCO|nr:unnamed protein product [Candida verbasci]
MNNHSNESIESFLSPPTNTRSRSYNSEITSTATPQNYSQSLLKSYNQTPPLTNDSRTLMSQQSLQYPYDSIYHHQPKVNNFEMADLNRDLPPTPRLQNKESNFNDPFSDEFTNPRNYDNILLPLSPHNSNPFNNSQNDLLENNNDRDLKHRLKRNEKNRLQTLRRKPRFHYTRLPYFTIIVTLIQVIVFIVELAKSSILTGSAFQTEPYFNPMLGPSASLLINMGARYVPCMHQIQNLTDDTSILFPCANSTSVDTYVCNLSQLCGLSELPVEGSKFLPNQWYRVFIPIFLHAGFLHIIFNLLLQVTMGASLERNIGILKYAIIYIASGIGGFLLGANFTPQGIASTGASGSLFGIVATEIILFIYTGRKNTNMFGTKHYTLFICIMVAEIIVSFVLGLLPGLDNFSHLGGFVVGILTAIGFLKDPFWIYKDGIITYRRDPTTMQQFINNWNPFFAVEDKIPTRLYTWFGVRTIALVLMIIYFVLLSKNFFNSDLDQGNNCEWCKYFNCIPVNGWCDIGQVSVTTSDSSGGTASSTPNETTVPTEIYTTETYTSSLPTSTNNPDSSNFKRELSSNTSNSNYSHGIGIGLYLILGLFIFSFLKRKKIV